MILPKISQNYFIQDFVPKDIYKLYGNSCIWWIDPQIVNIAELISQRFGKKATINNWMDGGTLNNRGTRFPNSTIGATNSQHRFKNAADCSIIGFTPEEIYNDIVTNFDIYSRAGLTTLENIKFTTGEREGDKFGWVHFDKRWTGRQELLIVNP